MLTRVVSNRQVVTVACRMARTRGVRPDMTLAEARAMCPGLSVADHEPEKDLRSLHGMGRWMIHFSPVVSVEPPDALMLDVGGCERLYGGLDRLTKRVTEALSKIGVAHNLAIAPTPGAAWAIASFSGVKGMIAGPDHVARIVPPLPVAALRLDHELMKSLHALGVETVAQALALPRQALPARFGSTLLTRLDQAFGHAAELLVPLEQPGAIKAQIEFECAVESLETTWKAFTLLIEQVIRGLRRQGQGVRMLKVDFKVDRAPGVRKTIHLSRPTRDAAVLFNLIRCAGETVRCERGFVGLSLQVASSESLGDQQLAFVEDELSAAGPQLDHLLERLRVRLGEGAALLARLAESHLPERACHFSQALDKVPAAVQAPLKARPLHLFPEPMEVACMASPSGEGLPVSFTWGEQVYRITQVSGPERIAGLWWEGRNKTRDYFDVEETSGRRFWLFRVGETRRWFLHGVFDG